MIKFYEYRDKAATGSEENFENVNDAIMFAQKRWNALWKADKMSYVNDPAAEFAVIDVHGKFIEKDYELIPVEDGDCNEDGSMADYDYIWKPEELQ